MYPDLMQIKRLVISAVIIAAAFYAASTLKVDVPYLKQLTATTMVRGMLSDMRDSLKSEGNPEIALSFTGEGSYQEGLRKEISRFEGVRVAQAAAHVLSVSVNEADGRINASLALSGGGKELFSEERSLRLAAWTSLLPPIFAILLAVCMRWVLASLTLSIWLGAALSQGFNPVKSAWYAASHYIWGNFVGEFSVLILGFVFILIGMVNVINRGGGMAGVVNQITRIARSARTACLSASFLGLGIFFDDYTNTIVVGTTMRSFTDRMRVSREKLAFIVDATSAPVAGLAILSTWIGFEVMQMHSVGEFLGLNTSGYSLFLKALPYRFYCIFAIFFVLLTSLLRRDFGPMLKAERRASLTGQVADPESDHVTDPVVKAADPKPGIPERWYNAAIPVLCVLVTIIAGILWRGSQIVAAKGEPFSLLGAFLSIGEDGNTLFVIMLVASAIGSLVATALMLAQRILTPLEILKAWLGSWKIIPAAAILVLAWSIRQVCDDLGTALYLSTLVKDLLNPILVPFAIFLLASAVSFATGTSFGTMGLLIPTVAPLAYTLGSPVLFFMSLGAVLDGAIFGDHCSPISDTTILSALSSSCDLMDHVRTQMPYAVCCMLVAGFCGYLLAAMGTPVYYLYPLGLVAILAILFIFGRNPEKAPRTQEELCEERITTPGSTFLAESTAAE